MRLGKTINLEQITEKAKANLLKSSKRRQAKFVLYKRLIQFQIGDLVKIKNINKSDARQKLIKKFQPIYEGPYVRVVAVVPYQNVYVLVDPKTNKVRGKFNAIHLTKYYL